MCLTQRVYNEEETETFSITPLSILLCSYTLHFYNPPLIPFNLASLTEFLFTCSLKAHISQSSILGLPSPPQYLESMTEQMLTTLTSLFVNSIPLKSRPEFPNT